MKTNILIFLAGVAAATLPQVMNHLEWRSPAAGEVRADEVRPNRARAVRERADREGDDREEEGVVRRGRDPGARGEADDDNGPGGGGVRGYRDDNREEAVRPPVGPRREERAERFESRH